MNNQSWFADPRKKKSQATWGFYFNFFLFFFSLNSWQIAGSRSQLVEVTLIRWMTLDGPLVGIISSASARIKPVASMRLGSSRIRPSVRSVWAWRTIYFIVVIRTYFLYSLLLSPHWNYDRLFIFYHIWYRGYICIKDKLRWIRYLPAIFDHPTIFICSSKIKLFFIFSMQKFSFQNQNKKTNKKTPKRERK